MEKNSTYIGVFGSSIADSRCTITIHWVGFVTHFDSLIEYQSNEFKEEEKGLGSSKKFLIDRDEVVRLQDPTNCFKDVIIEDLENQRI